MTNDSKTGSSNITTVSDKTMTSNSRCAMRSTITDERTRWKLFTIGAVWIQRAERQYYTHKLLILDFPGCCRILNYPAVSLTLSVRLSPYRRHGTMVIRAIGKWTRSASSLVWWETDDNTLSNCWLNTHVEDTMLLDELILVTKFSRASLSKMWP